MNDKLFAFQITEKLTTNNRPPGNIGVLSLISCVLISQWDASTGLWWPIRGPDSEVREADSDAVIELRRDIWFSVLDNCDEMVTWPCVTSVTSSWHATRAWHHGDWRHHGRVLCSCWVATDIQSSIRGTKIKLRQYGDNFLLHFMNPQTTEIRDINFCKYIQTQKCRTFWGWQGLI